MGNENNAAYVGEHTLPNGEHIAIRWFDRRACLARFNGGIGPLNPNYRRVGWYWTAYRGLDPMAAGAAIWHGPFSASGSAYRNAEAGPAAKRKHQSIASVISQ